MATRAVVIVLDMLLLFLVMVLIASSNKERGWWDRRVPHHHTILKTRFPTLKKNEFIQSQLIFSPYSLLLSQVQAIFVCMHGSEGVGQPWETNLRKTASTLLDIEWEWIYCLRPIRKLNLSSTPGVLLRSFPSTWHLFSIAGPRLECAKWEELH